MIFILLFTLYSHAWNALGHMVIAQIAYDRLNPDVKKKVDMMVANLGKEYPDITSFYQLGPWPDFLRAQKIETFTRWHYIDMAFSSDGTPLKNLQDTDNAAWAIQQIKPVVGNSKANPYERARFLAFLIHIVGDIHQPLHTVSRISSMNPDGDQGGNLYHIKYPVFKPQTITLHRLWDQGVDFFVAETTADKVLFLSHQITSSYPEKYFKNRFSNINVSDWVSEGFQSATTFVYSTPEDQVPSEQYLQSARQMTQQKAALAGYRLASMLNQILV